MRKKPFVVCHMMASLDGRIDCDMTEQIGGDGYYDALKELSLDSTIEGRLTAVKHYAEPEPFKADDGRQVGKPDFFRAHGGNHWEVVADTHGTLVFPEHDTPDRLVLTGEMAPQEYLDFLHGRNISYIAVGRDHIDLERALEVLYADFDVRRVGVVGGGHINGGFLQAGLIDEVSMLYGAAIDGREGFAAAFDGVPADHVHPWLLKLTQVRRMPDDSVWLRYNVEH